MKKIVSIVLSMLLVFTSASFALAASGGSAGGSSSVVKPLAIVETTVDIQVYTLNVTVKANEAGTKTLKIYPLTLNTETNEYEVKDMLSPVYLGQQSAYTVADGAYVYEFAPFNFLKTQATGQYRAVVNGKYNTDFTFVNKQDKIDIYNKLAAATTENIGAVLKEGVEKGCVDFDLGNYFDYPEEIKEKIDEQLAAVEVTSLGENPSDEAIKAFEDVFKPEVERMLKVAEFIVTAETDLDAAVEAYGKDLGLDLTYYSDEKLELADAVEKRFTTLPVDDFSKETITRTFDTAVLLAMLDKVDYGVVTEAIEHYDGGCVDVDESLTKDFTETEKNRVSIEMKKNAADIKDAADVAKAYKNAAETVAGTEEEDSGTSRPTTGGGGTGGGSRPGASRPGATTGSSTVDTSTGNKPATVTFSDLNDAAWAKTAIEYLASAGVLNGKGGNRFYPNDIVTREEFVKIIVEAFDIYNKNAEVSFDDVETGRWSYTYIASAYRAGLITGVSDTEFNPTGHITRQDMAVIMYRLAELLGLDLNGSASFADDASISGYAKAAVKALAGAGIVNGTGNNMFSPLSTVTRAQAAKVAYELLMATGGAK